MTRTFLLGSTLGCFILLYMALPALAETPVGLRAGVSGSPDQFFIGGHMEVGPVAEQLWFRPNIEAGFGNSRTLVGVNMEFTYWMPLQTGWNVYFGGGPALVVTTFSRPGGRDSDVGPGLNLLIGLAQRHGIMSEVKVGAFDSPEFKFTVGWTF